MSRYQGAHWGSEGSHRQEYLVPDNLHGYLEGSVDDYIESFDAQIAKLEAKFDHDRECTAKQTEIEDEVQGE